jgi:radical S-adenosyl methionine domain-containing protein 2
MSATLPTVLDLRLLGTCNLRCPFCFGPRHDLGARSIDEFTTLVARLPHHGVRAIVISGGEPTLVPELPALLRAAKGAGLNVALSTNGARLGERLAAIAPWLDWVALPLDGDQPQRHARMRVGSRAHFRTILQLIGRIRSEQPHVRVKLGTVVCAINRDWVVGLAEVVAGRYAPDVWKLYEVECAGYAHESWDRLALGEAEFDEILLRATEAARRNGIPIATYRRADRTGKYLFVEPNGDAMAVDDRNEVVIGNFFADLSGVLATWREHVLPDRLAGNVAMTYPGL